MIRDNNDTSHRGCGWLQAAAAGALLVIAGAASASERIVTTITELEAALADATPGRILRLMPGEYLAERPLIVPDGVSVLGSGHMSFDTDGTPAALQPSDATTIRAADALAGDLMSLGDRTRLRGLRVVVPARTVHGESVPSGNAIVIGSRRAGDRVSAVMSECEILTESKFGADFEGPTGRGVMMVTRNPTTQLPHEGARLKLAVDASIVRAPLGNALLANNFASGGALTLEVRRSRIEGITSIGGSTSRPDPVTGASVVFRSRRSLYRRAAGGIDRFGWQLYGGTGIPLATAGTSTAGSSHGMTRVESDSDRIEGFRTGVLAAGYRRVADYSGPGSDNRIELRMRNTIIRSAGEGASDFALLGAIGEPAPGGGLALPPGERNVVWADLRGVSGSGERKNRFLDRVGPDGAGSQDDGNRVVIAGRADVFAKSNPAILPTPPASAFK